MRTAAAVVAWNGAAHLGACLESLAAQALCPDVLVVDNASTDGTAALARSFEPRLTRRGRALRVLAQPVNLGFTGGANAAFREILAGGVHDLALLLNQDVVLDPGHVAHLVSVFERLPAAGAVGGKLLYPDGATIQHAGGFLARPRLVGLHHGQGQPDGEGLFDSERDVDFLTGAALGLRLACLQAVGLFDEVFSPGYYEDVDLCDRLRRAGWRVVYAPGARALHAESASFADRGERFLLAHRNRLAYALPSLAEPGGAEAFGAAEREAFPSEPTEILRALALAYLEATLRLHELAPARLGAAVRDPVTRETLASLLVGLREACLEELRRRRRERTG